MNTQRKARPNNPPSEHVQLYNVLTVYEVENGWHKHHKTVLAAIDTKRLTARQAGRTWLISFDSVVRLWGPPIENTEYLPF